MATSLPPFKVVLVGDAKVGKTSVLRRWAQGEFLDDYEPTVSPELTTKQVVVDGQSAIVQVWDIGFGETDTVAQFPRFARGAAGVLLMYDLSDASSVEGVDHWRQQVEQLASDTCVFVVVGCKSDLRVAPGVTQKARLLCDDLGAAHLETSARSRQNIAAVFETLAAHLLCQARGEAPPAYPPSPAPTSVLPASNGYDSEPPAVAKVVKLLVLGETRAGKTCLAQQIGGGQAFEEEYMPTAGPEILTRKATVNGKPLILQVWDLNAEDLLQNERMCSSVLQGVVAAMVLYDITSRDSFTNVGRWFRLLEEQAEPDVTVMLVGTKADSASARAVSANEGRALAESIRVPFAEASSRTGAGVASLVEALMAGGRGPINWAAAGAGAVLEGLASSQSVSKLASQYSATGTANKYASVGSTRPARDSSADPASRARTFADRISSTLPSEPMAGSSTASLGLTNDRLANTVTNDRLANTDAFAATFDTAGKGNAPATSWQDVAAGRRPIKQRDTDTDSLVSGISGYSHRPMISPMGGNARVGLDMSSSLMEQQPSGTGNRQDLESSAVSLRTFTDQGAVPGGQPGDVTPPPFRSPSVTGSQNTSVPPRSYAFNALGTPGTSGRTAVAAGAPGASAAPPRSPSNQDFARSELSQGPRASPAPLARSQAGERNPRPAIGGLQSKDSPGESNRTPFQRGQPAYGTYGSPPGQVGAPRAEGSMIQPSPGMPLRRAGVSPSPSSQLQRGTSRPNPSPAPMGAPGATGQTPLVRQQPLGTPARTFGQSPPANYNR